MIRSPSPWPRCAAILVALGHGACGGSEPPASRPALTVRAPGAPITRQPRAGAREIECARPDYDCGYIGLNKCETECAAGVLDDCVALARWHEENHRLGGERSRALELLRSACAKGHGPACVDLVANPGATAEDRAAPTAALSAACARGDLCACSYHGTALTLIPHEEDRGIDRLSESCARGSLDACDTLNLMTEICERDDVRTGHCARLRADRPRSPDRPPSEGPRWEAAPLPASLEGCFKVAPPPPGRPPCVAADAVEGSGSDPQGDYQPCPLDGSLDEGALFCFAKDRYLVKPMRAPWDVRPVEWQTAPDQRAFRPHQEQIEVRTPSGSLIGQHGFVDELRLRGQDTVVVGLGLAVRVTRITGPEGDAVRREIAGLPGLEQACRSAARCEAAIPGGLDLPPDGGLRSCLARAEAARAALVKKRGEGEARRLCP